MSRVRHYHVEDAGDPPARSGPLATFTEAKHVAFVMVTHARATGIWRAWRVTWSDPPAGYHRWSGFTDPKGPAAGEYTDDITVVPCTEVH